MSSKTISPNKREISQKEMHQLINILFEQLQNTNSKPTLKKSFREGTLTFLNALIVSFESTETTNKSKSLTVRLTRKLLSPKDSSEVRARALRLSKLTLPLNFSSKAMLEAYKELGVIDTEGIVQDPNKDVINKSSFKNNPAKRDSREVVKKRAQRLTALTYP